MIRKIALGATSLMLALGGSAALSAGVAHAAAPPVNATGSASCGVTGKVKVSPALTNTDHGPATMTLKVTIAGCTGSSGVVSGKGTFTSVFSSSSCAALATQHPSTTGSIKWKGAVKLNPSNVTFSNSSSTVTDPVTLKLPSAGPTPAAGTSSISGSFAGESAHVTLVADQSISTLAPLCDGKGIKKLSFSGVQGPSSFSVAP